MPTTDRMPLPYGVNDLWPQPKLASDRPRRVRCYVRGCNNIIETPRRGTRSQICPVHRISCHFSSAGATYSYRDPRRNIVASPDLFADQIIQNPFKYETGRFGLENSEDAVSWNVFRSFQEVGQLHKIAQHITGQDWDDEPNLYLWGLGCSGETFRPWELLVAARDRFELDLPVKRPLTEPDIALHLPGRYLVLIEAKFTSPNTYYEHGPRRDRSSLTFSELLDIYHDPKLQIVNLRAAKQASRVPYQLWRNMVFAEWMAQLDGPLTDAYHANLVRDGYEEEAASEFGRLIRLEYRNRFRRITWEEIYQLATGTKLGRLRAYIETKTTGLRPAFWV